MNPEDTAQSGAQNNIIPEQEIDPYKDILAGRGGRAIDSRPANKTFVCFVSLVSKLTGYNGLKNHNKREVVDGVKDSLDNENFRIIEKSNENYHVLESVTQIEKIRILLRSRYAKIDLEDFKKKPAYNDAIILVKNFSETSLGQRYLSNEKEYIDAECSRLEKNPDFKARQKSYSSTEIILPKTSVGMNDASPPIDDNQQGIEEETVNRPLAHAMQQVVSEAGMFDELKNAVNSGLDSNLANVIEKALTKCSEDARNKYQEAKQNAENEVSLRNQKISQSKTAIEKYKDVNIQIFSHAGMRDVFEQAFDENMQNAIAENPENEICLNVLAEEALSSFPLKKDQEEHRKALQKARDDLKKPPPKKRKFNPDDFKGDNPLKRDDNDSDRGTGLSGR